MINFWFFVGWAVVLENFHVSARVMFPKIGHEPILPMEVVQNLIANRLVIEMANVALPVLADHEGMQAVLLLGLSPSEDGLGAFGRTVFLKFRANQLDFAAPKAHTLTICVGLDGISGELEGAILEGFRHLLYFRILCWLPHVKNLRKPSCGPLWLS